MALVGNHFSVEVRRRQRAAIVVPCGELDLASAPALEAELERAWRSDAESVIIDLRALEFMDSTGVHVIITAQRRGQVSNRRFGVVDGGEQVHRLLRLTGVLDRLSLVAAPDEPLQR